MNEPTIRHIDPGTPVDLTNCDREPIHLLGRVQSYGALVALSPDWVIQHASENLGTILDHHDGEGIGQNIDEIVDASAIARLSTAMTRGDITQTAVRLFGVELKNNGRLFDLSLHQSDQYLILEFEPKAAERGSDVMSEVYPLIQNIDTTKDLAQLADDAARGLAEIAGFDSVMVYEFEISPTASLRPNGRKSSAI